MEARRPTIAFRAGAPRAARQHRLLLVVLRISWPQCSQMVNRASGGSPLSIAGWRELQDLELAARGHATQYFR